MTEELYRFGDFELDRGAYQLRCLGRDMRLERIPLDVLFLLVEKGGRLVSREEILEHVWGKDVFVDVDNSINTAVRKIRLALKDNPDAPLFVATVQSKGYRFVASIEKLTNSPSLAPASSVPQGGVPADLRPSDRKAQSQSTPQSALAHVKAGTRLRKILLPAAIVLAIAFTSFFHFRRGKPALSETDTIVLADFTNTTGDVIFDGTLREGLAVQLQQSPFLNLVSDEQVHQTLRMMNQQPDARLTPEIATEICHRTNATAVLEGSIGQIGGSYDLILKAVNCSTGESFAGTQAEANDKNHILDALGKASSDIRKKLGESLATIRKFDAPLVQATTPSLDALKSYSLALSKYGSGDQVGSIPLFQQAIDVDPDFAMAYVNLGRAYQVLGQFGRTQDEIRKAFSLRDRVSERERFDISSAFHQFVTFEIEPTVRNCELWEQSYPRDFTPHRILGFEYAVLAKYDRSAEEFRAAMELDPRQALPYAGLINDYSALNRFAEAREVYQQALARNLGGGEVRHQRYKLAFIEGDTQTMATIAASMAGEPGFENIALAEESSTAAYFGRLNAARELLERSEAMFLRQRDQQTAARLESDFATLEALVGNSAAAHKKAVEAGKRGWQPAMALALVGDSVSATKLLDHLTISQSPAAGLVAEITVPEIRGVIELQRGNPLRALELFATVVPYEAGWFDLYTAAYLRGQAYLAAHRGQDAVAEFQKIIDHRGVVANSEIGALAQLGVARAYALQGDSPKARIAYQNFLALWNHADPNIPVLKQAQSEYSKLQ
jgi:DNA-binding winged helix-turn-helix (wHTH) protein/tetratricopeptide (TPR) repeat protein